MIFRRIPSLPGYSVSAFGDVRGPRGTVIKPSPDHQGYLRVQVRIVHTCGAWIHRTLRRWRRVHLLVLEAWRGPKPSPRHVGAHGKEGRSVNALRNLTWATPEENERHKRRDGTVSGGKRYAGRATAEQVERIHERVARGESYSSIARSLRCHRSSIARIAKGKRHGRAA